MKYSLLTAGISFGFGILVLAISLTSTSQATASSQPRTISTKKFYLNEPIRPDHVLYPILSLGDMVATLAARNPEDELQVILAQYHQRLADCHYLWEQQNYTVAVDTLQKAQSELIAANQLVKSGEMKRSKSLVTQELLDLRQKISTHLLTSPAEYQPILNKLLQELDAEIQSVS